MIYLDNAATEKPEEDCVNSNLRYLLDDFYNPSSLYNEGYKLHLELATSRENIISCIADNNYFDLIFTSCGTEADNQAIFCGAKRGNVVTTSGEHSAIFSAVQELKTRGTEIRFANLNADGSVDEEHLLSLVDDKTSLVSVIHVNNETGAINDIIKLAERVKRKNKYALFHSDGVQAFGKLIFKLTPNIDMYSVSAHKIGGVRGCGALVKKKNLNIKPYVYGGGQEKGMRSGTENVFAIKCFEAATLKRYNKISDDYKYVAKLKESFIELLDNNDFTVICRGGSPYILSLAVRGLRGETILHEANDRGLVIGTGSACSSNEKKRYSRVLTACGYDNITLDGVLRISFSYRNKSEEIAEAARILNEVVKHRKEMM